MRIHYPVLLLFTALCFAATASAQVTLDVPQGFVQVEPGHFVMTPAGNAPPLHEQGLVLHIWLHDPNGLSVANYPYQDIWLGNGGSGEIHICAGAGRADQDTDIDGYTTLSGVIHGGGWTLGGMSVYVKGVALPQTQWGSDTLLPLVANSPDINGDLMVGLSDITLFINDLQGYAFRSDFNYDGEVDLSDISIFINHVEESCP